MCADGSITVFISLILPLIFALVGVSLESARASGMEMRLRLAADAAIDSVFAEYDDALWGNFHLLFRSAGDRSGDKLRARVMSYAEEGLGKGVNFLGKYTDWFTLSPTEADISDVVFATDQHGAVFEQAVLDYMESGIIPILIDEMISRLGVFSDGDAKEKLEESSGKGEFSFNSIYGDYKNLKKKAEEAKLEEERRAAEEAGTGEEGEEGGGTGEGDPSVEEPPQEEPGLTLDDILETVKTLMMHGFMGIVVDTPNAISRKPIGSSGFPSKLPGKEKGRHAALSPVSATSSSGSIKRRLLVDEYLLRFLDCYTSEDKPDEEETNLPEFQVEYVIAGKNSDYDNLKSVVNRLLWLREGLNMVHLVGDPVKREEVLTLATALMTPTGQLYLIAPAAGLLMAAWAFAESLHDVKALLAGGRVPLLKTQESWKTSLENISADIASASGTLGEEELPSGSGLTYVDYLRIFLAFADPESRNYRGMDMIHVVMKKTRADFDMTQCVYACSATLTAAGPYRFLVFSHLLQGDRQGGYNLSCKTWFGYRRRVE